MEEKWYMCFVEVLIWCVKVWVFLNFIFVIFLLLFKGMIWFLLMECCGVVFVCCIVYIVIDVVGIVFIYFVLVKVKVNRKNNMIVINFFIVYCLVYKDNINSVLDFILYNN